MILACFSCCGRFRLKVTVSEHDEATLRQMLEYIYTNRVKDMLGLSADEVIKLLALANGESESALGGRCVISPAWGVAPPCPAL